MPRATATRYETQFETLPDLITVEEAAEMLGVTATRVRQLIGDRRFRRVVLVGSRPLNLLDRAEVRALSKA